jgi:2-polyprenyl-3-methyl-5-hydroxy-6-metoxy-1,4-benzoquinol methylase
MAASKLKVEQAFHDSQAESRSETFQAHPDRFTVHDDVYLDHESWIRPAFQALGAMRGLRVLDCGAGHGMAAVVLARRGASVTALDLSHGYVQEARQRAVANGAVIDFLQADAERLPFADASFDRIWGNAILHHLEMNAAAREIKRVLKPGGRAVFCEPLGENPLLNWARTRVAYAGKARTPDETPLRERHLEILRGHFSKVTVHGHQLLSMARRVLRHRQLVRGLDWCDRMLLARVPRLQIYCRYAIIVLDC